MAVNSQDTDETYHEIPAHNYIFLYNIAIHKDFFQAWTLLTILGTAITLLIAVYTNWWQLLALSLANLIFIKAWFITYPAILIATPITYWWYTRKQKQKLIQKKKDAENKKIRAILMAGGEQKK